MDIIIKYERFGSHSGDDENFSILGCDTVSFGRQLLVFQTTILPSAMRSSGFLRSE
jgi:hypothetical protein